LNPSVRKTNGVRNCTRNLFVPADAWQGTWTARIAPDRIYSGTWSAFMSGTPARTLGDMLDATLEKDVAGR
jgi:hypothetical protein